MPLTDICVNLTNAQFRSDRDAVIDRARAAGVTRLVLTGTDLDSSRALIDLSSGEDIVSTAGIHPHDIGKAPADWVERLEALLSEPSVRAVGETGLDFNRNYSEPAAQRAGFAQQIALAQRHDLPLFVHDRDSGGEVAHVLKAAGDLPATVVHCFTGTADDLATYVEADYYIGITGWVADPKRGAGLRALVPKIPLTRLMLETDAPFLRPQNAPSAALAGLPKRRNEPALLRYVLAAVAAARPESEAEIAAASQANAARFFGFTGSA